MGQYYPNQNDPMTSYYLSLLRMILCTSRFRVIAQLGGLKGKLNSLNENVKFFNKPTCVNIQKPNIDFKVCFPKYQKWYGRWTFVSQDVIPVLISAGNENIELIAVQGKIGNHDIRIFNFYGPNHSANC